MIQPLQLHQVVIPKSQLGQSATGLQILNAAINSGIDQRIFQGRLPHCYINESRDDYTCVFEVKN